jgi:hypothetical protein
VFGRIPLEKGVKEFRTIKISNMTAEECRKRVDFLSFFTM